MHDNAATQNPNPDQIALILKTLADPNRLRVFQALMRGASCNGWLTEELGLSPTLLSHHLKVLREAGLVQDRRDAVDGRWIYYHVNLPALADMYHWFVHAFDPEEVTLGTTLCGPENSVIADVVAESKREKAAA